MTFCTNCGKKFNSGATSCDACGATLPAANPPAPESTKPGRGSAPDALKTQVSSPGTAGDFSTGVGSTLPLSQITIGTQSGRLLGGRYKLEQCIGSGGMGEIYRARRTHIGDTVAVKVLRADVVENEKSRQRFYREARAAAMLHHPNAVVIHDFGEDDDGTAYIVMELLEGRSLRQLLVEESSIDAFRAYGITRQASAALDAGHRNGIVHRDIKPDNIILLDSNDGADHVKILDFGIAKVLDMALDTHSLEQRLTNVGAVIGTPHYMSPEQCQGEEADARSDIYSLGVVMYELLTGVAPFLAKTPTGVAIKHVTEKPRPLREINPSVPELVERAVLHALEKDPNARPQTALEFAREFENALSNDPDTMRLRRSGEQARVEKPRPNRAAEPAGPGGFGSEAKQPEAPPQKPAAPQQSYETRISSPPATDQWQQLGGAATDQLKHADSAATDVLNRAKLTAEQVKPKTDVAGGGGAESEVSPPPSLKTEALPKSKVTKAAEPTPATTDLPRSSARPTGNISTESANASAPTVISGADPLRTDPMGLTSRLDEPDKRKTAASAPAPSPAAPRAEKTSGAPAAKSKLPLLIVAGVVVVGLIAVVVALMLKSKDSNAGQQTAQTTAPSPVAAASPAATPGSSYPDIGAPEGMVYVLGGVLRIGRDDGDENERPAHVLTIRPFFIDRTEVTNAQYQRFIEAAGYAPPPSWQGSHFPEGSDNLPVTDVTWDDANAYAQWANRRLPTEEEWEFAARGADERYIYPWGEDWVADAANVTANDNDKRQLQPVGQFPKGASPFGLMDMIGNAWEWTANDYKAYPGGKVEDLPAGFSNFKTLRGGSYQSKGSKTTATLRRGWPASRNDWPKGRTPEYTQTGFRTAKDVKAP
jgi:serine/threonine-protein kinase